jgi:hypothetical protein
MVAKITMLIVIPINEKQEARLKAFCRMIDASLGEFTAYALESEIEFQLEHWKPERIKRLKALTRSMTRSMARSALDRTTQQRK